MDHEPLTWDAPEYHHFEKNADWYWSVGIITVAIAVICILFNNILFALFIILSAFTASMYASRHPELAHIEIKPRGIRISDKVYPYNTLESFWIDEEDHPQKIILKSKKLLMPFIVIPIGHIHHEDIRAILRKHLKEVEHHESILHKAFEYFGF